MSVFLSCFLGCLCAFGVIAVLFTILMIVAVIEYKRKQKRDMRELSDNLTTMFSGGVD